MFSVYVNNFNAIPDTDWSNGDTETLLFTIPNQNGSIRPFLTATVSNEMGSAGNFEFSIDFKNIWYNIWKHMRTLVRVEYDGDTIFYGRVLSISRDMFRNKQIHCEGAMTFFMDSVYEGTKDGTQMTIYQYLTALINAHNDCMGSATEKKIQLGEVPGHYSNSITSEQQVVSGSEQQKFGKGQGYKAVKDWLEELVTDYAGSMRVRYSNGTLYLDWLKNYFNAAESNQTMSVSSNVVDLSDTVEVNNIFTHVIPVGKNNKYIDGTSSGGGGGGGGGGGSGGSGQYTITYSVNPSGNVVVNGSTYNNTVNGNTTRANAGQTIRFTANPAPGYWFTGWEVRPNTVTVSGGINGSLVMPAANITVIGQFSTASSDDGIVET